MRSEKLPEPFTVSVHAGFDEGGVWVIDARLTFRDGAPPPGDQLIGKGRLALLTEIMREGQRGRSLGATKARLQMDDGTGSPTTTDIVPGELPK